MAKKETPPKVRSLMVKTPFVKIRPKGSYNDTPIIGDMTNLNATNDMLTYELISQSDFLREYFVSGHKINDPAWYPDKTTYNDTEQIKQINNGRGAWVTEKVARCAFPFQFIITLKQLIALCGNPIKLTSSIKYLSDEDIDNLAAFKNGWKDKNMEVAVFEAIRSEKITGDCATLFYFDKDKNVCWRTLSFLDGVKLYPQYDPCGQMTAFLREYKRYNEGGEVRTSVVEYWDDTYFYTFEKDSSSKLATLKNSIVEALGLDGYRLVGEPKAHGFKECPVVYNRSLIGACWSLSQDNIDAYELSVSQLCENNKTFAFPILVIAGDGDVDIKGTSTGRPFAILSNDHDTKVDLLSSQGNSSDSFKLQIETLLKNIFLGSFIVTPPEVRSGDLAGIAIKLIYSPSLEMAIAESNHWNIYIDKMVRLFSFGFGIEQKKTADFNKLMIKGEIIPYIHESISETINLICSSVNSGILSVETASSIHPMGMSDEYKRVLREQLEALPHEGKIITTTPSTTPPQIIKPQK